MLQKGTPKPALVKAKVTKGLLEKSVSYVSEMLNSYIQLRMAEKSYCGGHIVTAYHHRER